MINKSILLFLLIIGNATTAQNWLGVNNGYSQPLLSLTTSTDKLYIGVYVTEPGIYHIKTWDGIILDSLDCSNQPLKMIFNNGFLYECGCERGIRKYDGNSWQTIGSPSLTGGIIKDFSIYNNEIFAIGSFDTINGVPLNGIGRWDGNNWNSFDTSTFTGGGLRFCIHYNGEFYVGGAFQNWNATLATLIKWNGSAWEDVVLGTLNGSINPFTAEVYNNELYMGGIISTSDSLGSGVVRYDGNVWKSVENGIHGGSTPRVYALKQINDQLIVAGAFDSAGTILAGNIAAWDGSNWCSMSSDMDGMIFALAEFDSSIVIAGGFTNIDGDSINNLAAWNIGNNYDTCSTITNIFELEELEEIFLFPNPSEKILNISSLNIEIKSIKIVNLTGHEKFSNVVGRFYCQLDISFLSSNIYFIVIETMNGRVVKKFIKE